MAASSDGSKVLLNDGCLYDLTSGSCEADLTQGHGAETFRVFSALPTIFPVSISSIAKR